METRSSPRASARDMCPRARATRKVCLAQPTRVRSQASRHWRHAGSVKDPGCGVLLRACLAQAGISITSARPEEGREREVRSIHTVHSAKA